MIMVIFIFGEDTFRSKEKLRALKDKYRREVDPAGLNLAEMAGADFSPEKFKQTATAQAFMAKKRMVVVKNLLFLKKQKTVWDAVLAYLTEVTSEPILIFWEENPDRTSALFKFLKQEKYSYEFKFLPATGLNRWIIGRAELLGKKIEPGAVSLLGAVVGSDLWRMANELQKLVSFA